jgi:SPW repeat
VDRQPYGTDGRGETDVLVAAMEEKGMRFIPTRVHGMLDYSMGALLIIAPWLLGFAAGGAETWVPVILGAGAIVYSLFTDYELGLVRRIPMGTHLGLDLGSGALLAVSPWLFGFADLVYLPHLILGLLEIGAALTTRTTPEDRRAVGVAHTGRPRA